MDTAPALQSSPAKKNSPIVFIMVVIGGFIFFCLGCTIFSAIGQAVGFIPTSVPTQSVSPDQVDTLPTAEKVKNTPLPIKPTRTAKPSVPTQSPVPTDIPTTPPLGESRDNPIPAGNPVQLSGDMTLTVMNALRPADDIVANGNMFNTKPESGQEYMKVDVQVVCNKASKDKCYFAATQIKAVGSDGNIIDSQILLAGVEGVIDSGEFFGGGTRKGSLFFLVSQGDNSVILFSDPLLFGNTVYFSLP